MVLSWEEFYESGIMIRAIPWVTVLRQRLWGARKITDSLSASIKIDHTCEEEVDGEHNGFKA